MAGTTTYYGVSYPTNTDYVKDGASAIQTVATGFDSAVAIPTYNAQTGTTYTFALTDVGKTVTASNASASTYTIPPTASVAWPTNATLYVINLGAGVVTFAAGAGVTVTNTTQTLAQYQSARLVRTALNAWTVTPDSGQTSGGLTLIKSQTIGSAVSSVNVTDAFSTTYDNYRIIVNGGVASVGQYLTLKIGSATTAYYGARFVMDFTANTSANLANNNLSTFQYAGFGTTGNLHFNLDVYQPFASKTTQVTGLYSAMSDNFGAVFTGYLNNTNSYTDFTIGATGAGTLTGGTIYVYGYNK